MGLFDEIFAPEIPEPTGKKLDKARLKKYLELAEAGDPDAYDKYVQETGILGGMQGIDAPAGQRALRRDEFQANLRSRVSRQNLTLAEQDRRRNIGHDLMAQEARLFSDFQSGAIDKTEHDSRLQRLRGAYVEEVQATDRAHDAVLGAIESQTPSPEDRAEGSIQKMEEAMGGVWTGGLGVGLWAARNILPKRPGHEMAFDEVGGFATGKMPREKYFYGSGPNTLEDSHSVSNEAANTLTDMLTGDTPQDRKNRNLASLPPDEAIDAALRYEELERQQADEPILAKASRAVQRLTTGLGALGLVMKGVGKPSTSALPQAQTMESYQRALAANRRKVADLRDEAILARQAGQVEKGSRIDAAANEWDAIGNLLSRGTPLSTKAIGRMAPELERIFRAELAMGREPDEALKTASALTLLFGGSAVAADKFGLGALSSSALTGTIAAAHSWHETGEVEGLSAEDRTIEALTAGFGIATMHAYGRVASDPRISQRARANFNRIRNMTPSEMSAFVRGQHSAGTTSLSAGMSKAETYRADNSSELVAAVRLGNAVAQDPTVLTRLRLAMDPGPPPESAQPPRSFGLSMKDVSPADSGQWGSRIAKAKETKGGRLQPRKTEWIDAGALAGSLQQTANAEDAPLDTRASAQMLLDEINSVYFSPTVNKEYAARGRRELLEAATEFASQYGHQYQILPEPRALQKGDRATRPDGSEVNVLGPTEGNRLIVEEGGQISHADPSDLTLVEPMAAGAPDYTGIHEAPNRGDDYSASMDAMDKMYPGDIYSEEGARLYGSGSDPSRDRAIHSLIVSARGNPDAEVTVYRGIPAGVEPVINPGDWVSPDRQYAEDHASRYGEHQVVSKTVRAGDLFTEGNSLYEFGWSPAQEVTDLAQPTPPASDPVLTASLFSGAGTMEAGMSQGAQSVYAAEYSQKISDAFNRAHGTKFKPQDVNERNKKTGELIVVEGINASPSKFGHFSPVCKSFSEARGKPPTKAQLAHDLKTSRNLGEVIRKTNLNGIVIENVPKYSTFDDGNLIKPIIDALEESGFEHRLVIHDAADYGAPMTRNRMLLLAAKRGTGVDLDAIANAPKTGPADWYETIGDLVTGPGHARDNEKFFGYGEGKNILAAIESGKLRGDKPIITMGHSKGQSKGGINARNGGIEGSPTPAPVIVSSPKSVPRILIPTGTGADNTSFTVHRLEQRGLLRLFGLPESFPLPDSFPQAKEIIGNGISGHTTRTFIEPLARRSSGLRLGPAPQSPTAPIREGGPWREQAQQLEQTRERYREEHKLGWDSHRVGDWVAPDEFRLGPFSSRLPVSENLRLLQDSPIEFGVLIGDFGEGEPRIMGLATKGSHKETYHATEMTSPRRPTKPEELLRLHNHPHGVRMRHRIPGVTEPLESPIGGLGVPSAADILADVDVDAPHSAILWGDRVTLIRWKQGWTKGDGVGSKQKVVLKDDSGDSFSASRMNANRWLEEAVTEHWVKEARRAMRVVPSLFAEEVPTPEGGWTSREQVVEAYMEWAERRIPSILTEGWQSSSPDLAPSDRTSTGGIGAVKEALAEFGLDAEITTHDVGEITSGESLRRLLAVRDDRPSRSRGAPGSVGESGLSSGAPGPRALGAATVPPTEGEGPQIVRPSTERSLQDIEAASEANEVAQDLGYGYIARPQTGLRVDEGAKLMTRIMNAWDKPIAEVDPQLAKDVIEFTQTHLLPNDLFKESGAGARNMTTGDFKEIFKKWKTEWSEGKDLKGSDLGGNLPEGLFDKATGLIGVHDILNRIDARDTRALSKKIGWQKGNQRWTPEEQAILQKLAEQRRLSREQRKALEEARQKVGNIDPHKIARQYHQNLRRSIWAEMMNMGQEIQFGGPRVFYGLDRSGNAIEGPGANLLEVLSHMTGRDFPIAQATRVSFNVAYESTSNGGDFKARTEAIAKEVAKASGEWAGKSGDAREQMVEDAAKLLRDNILPGLISNNKRYAISFSDRQKIPDAQYEKLEKIANEMSRLMKPTFTGIKKLVRYLRYKNEELGIDHNRLEEAPDTHHYFPPETLDRIKALEGKSITEVPADDYALAVDAVTRAMVVWKKKNLIITADKAMVKAEVVDKTVKALKRAWKNRPKAALPKAGDSGREVPGLVRRGGRVYLSSTLNFENFISGMFNWVPDRGKRVSSFETVMVDGKKTQVPDGLADLLFNNADRGFIQVLSDEMEVQRWFDTMLKRYGYADGVNDKSFDLNSEETVREFTIGSAERNEPVSTVKLTANEAMGFYLMMKDPETRRDAFSMGLGFSLKRDPAGIALKKKEGTRKKEGNGSVTPDSYREWFDEWVSTEEGQRQYAIAEELWKRVNRADVVRDMLINHEIIDGTPGQFRAQFWMRLRNFRQAEAKAPPKFGESSPSGAHLERSSRYQKRHGSPAPFFIVPATDAFFEMTNAQSAYVNLAVPLMNARELLQSNEVRNLIESTYGAHGNETISKWMKDITRQALGKAAPDEDPLTNQAKGLIGAFAKFTEQSFIANVLSAPKIWLYQTMSYPLLGSEIDAKYLSQARKEFLPLTVIQNPESRAKISKLLSLGMDEWWKKGTTSGHWLHEAYDIPELAYRRHRDPREVAVGMFEMRRRFPGERRGKLDALQEWQRHWLAPIAQMDWLTISLGLQAAKMQIKDTTDLEPGSEEYNEAVRELIVTAVRRSQTGPMPQDVIPSKKFFGKHTLARWLLGQFRGPRDAIFNLGVLNYRRVQAQHEQAKQDFKDGKINEKQRAKAEKDAWKTFRNRFLLPTGFNMLMVAVIREMTKAALHSGPEVSTQLAEGGALGILDAVGEPDLRMRAAFFSKITEDAAKGLISIPPGVGDATVALYDVVRQRLANKRPADIDIGTNVSVEWLKAVWGMADMFIESMDPSETAELEAYLNDVRGPNRRENYPHQETVERYLSFMDLALKATGSPGYMEDWAKAFARTAPIVEVNGRKKPLISGKSPLDYKAEALFVTDIRETIAVLNLIEEWEETRAPITDEERAAYRRSGVGKRAEEPFTPGRLVRMLPERFRTDPNVIRDGRIAPGAFNYIQKEYRRRLKETKDELRSEGKMEN